ncbi:hypothetical protein BU24DRAFT_416226 [Aaosphaeria arxii CBS 175.79]|uniref:Uncharacterized protein n=1 Tax=Aaosphaeria arxii CBS 175.79 TaxID=1450172 RepID=A0A6A5Y5J7_9PLEO|nr:uncharacterized protein BU24DRAFT_416226 [Aaosphaeria arxii CBS 175.79]KAF2020556.1 hypothetical protein BU24DRAFT_416226 [Aaosphaeria arxii CBS 175.79]
MPPTRLTDREPPAVVTNSTKGATAPLRKSRLPVYLRLPLLVSLSLIIRSTLWTFASDLTQNELGFVSKRESETSAVVSHLAFKVLLLWAGWALKLDFYDVSAATAVSITPYAYLINTYYGVSSSTVAIFVAIEILSTAIPTYLLQRRSAVHNPRAALRNRFLIDSFQVQQSTSLLAVGVYVTVLFTAVKTDLLNVWLVTHFDIPTLENAHSETVATLAAKLLIIGVSAKAFLLNPSIGAESASGSATPVEVFDPATSDLPATIRHNVWFWSKRTRTLISQTAFLSSLLFANTVQRVLTLKGTELAGAAGYAGLWVFATLVTAGWWAWIGDTEA